jgi:hypothetical protein
MPQIKVKLRIWRKLFLLNALNASVNTVKFALIECKFD